MIDDIGAVSYTHLDVYKRQAWVYDVICEVNIVESIHYRPDTEDYTQIIPEICLSDLSN